MLMLAFTHHKPSNPLLTCGCHMHVDAAMPSMRMPPHITNPLLPLPPFCSHEVVLRMWSQPCACRCFASELKLVAEHCLSKLGGQLGLVAADGVTIGHACRKLERRACACRRRYQEEGAQISGRAAEGCALGWKVFRSQNSNRRQATADGLGGRLLQVTILNPHLWPCIPG